MSNGRSLSLPELDERIALLRANIAQLVEQAAASSGAEDENRNADRIAQQSDELARLVKERDALQAIVPPAKPKRAAPKKAALKKTNPRAKVKPAKAKPTTKRAKAKPTTKRAKAKPPTKRAKAKKRK